MGGCGSAGETIIGDAMALSKLLSSIRRAAKTAEKEIPLSSIVESRWDQYLLRKNEQGRIARKPQLGRYSPSGIHDCPVAIVLTQMNQIPTNSVQPPIIRIFSMGTAMHRMIQDELQEAGVLKQAEMHTEEKEYGIRGTADGLGDVNGKQFLLEIKSMNMRNFQDLQEATEDHQAQLSCYMFASGVHRGLFIYMNKNNQTLKMFEVKFRRELIEPFLSKIDEINADVMKKRLPKRPEGYTRTGECSQCKYKDGCWAGKYDLQFPKCKMVGHRLDIIGGKND